ncbi:hypothetical protein GDO81_001646 [Engystomops pustulosus]|uniref:Uncharacterized protein n=1 Tax=Engystomops pustulosus TaxID=76066 RepID=A0AAV7DFY9_ENGPU|nr:hypothetical protein GDO81_001646 [Engystomops pustulosus]
MTTCHLITCKSHFGTGEIFLLPYVIHMIQDQNSVRTVLFIGEVQYVSEGFSSNYYLWYYDFLKRSALCGSILCTRSFKEHPDTQRCA